MNHFKRGAGKMTQLLKRLPYKWMKSRFLEPTEKSRHSGTCSLSQRWSDTQADPWSSLAVGPVYLVKFQANDRPCLRQKVECIWTRMTPQALALMYTQVPWPPMCTHACIHHHTQEHTNTHAHCYPHPPKYCSFSLSGPSPQSVCVFQRLLSEICL